MPEDGGAVELEEMGGRTCMIECRRPPSARTALDVIRSAMRQLGRREHAGLVAVSLTNLLPSRWILVEDLPPSLDGFRSAMEALVAPWRERLIATFSPLPRASVLGIVFVADTVVAHPDERGGGFLVQPHSTTLTLNNPHAPELAVLVELYTRILTIGVGRG